MYQHIGHRRLTAIMVAEVVDYVHRMAEFGDGASEALQVHRATVIEPRIKQFDGRVVKQEGDSLVAEFASPVEAVRAAVAIQDGLEERNDLVSEDRRIEFRIGIHVGEMIVENFLLYGDGPKIAGYLKTLAEPGGICLSRSVVNQVDANTPFLFEDLGDQEIPDYPAPLRAYRMLSDAELPPPEARPKPQRPKAGFARHWPTIALAAAFLTLLVSGGVWLIPQPPELTAADPSRLSLPLPDRPSIAVLPLTFAADSDDEDAPEKAFLADRLSAGIIDGLAHDRALFVIARDSSFAYRDQETPPHRVAEELGVRFVLTGQIEQEDDQAKVTMRLVDTAAGGYVWRHRYDAAADKLPQLQEGLARSIVVSLRGYMGTLQQADLQGGAPRTRVDRQAFEQVERGIAYRERFTRADNEIAKELFAKAAELDRDFAPAYAWLAGIKATEVFLGWSDHPAEATTAALNLAQKALDLEPGSDVAHWALGRAYLAAGDTPRALAAMERALAFNPNNPDIMADLAWPLALLGRGAEAMAVVERAMRLNPHHGDWYFWRLGLGAYFAERYDEAIASLGRMTRHNAHSRLLLAASYAQRGAAARAGREVEEAVRIDPTISLAGYRDWRGRFASEADFERLIAGLEGAGLPEDPPGAPLVKPIVAVTSFENLSGDKSQAYLALGLTDDIVTDLARVPKLAVQAPRPAGAGREAAGYLLEGGIEKAADGFRVKARLIEQESGITLWSERPERDFADLFEVRAMLHDAVVTALTGDRAAGHGGMIASARATAPDVETMDRAKKLDARDYYYRAMDFYAAAERAANGRARALLEIALELDPENVAAQVLLARTHLRDRQYNWSADAEQSLQMGLAAAQRAVALDDWSYRGHWALGALLRSQGEAETAASAYRRAVELNPNDPELMLDWGEFLLHRGEPKAAIGPLKEAAALLWSDADRPLNLLSEAYYQTRQYEAAVGAGRQTADPAMRPRSVLVASYGQLGRSDEAEAEIRAARELDPSFSLSSASGQLMLLQPDQRAHFIEGLRKAGLGD